MRVFALPMSRPSSPQFGKAFAISLLPMSLASFLSNQPPCALLAKCLRSFCSTCEPIEFPTIRKSLCNLPASNEPCEFLSNQSPYGLTAKRLRSFCSTYEPMEFPTIPKSLCNLPATDEPCEFLSNQSPYGLTAKMPMEFLLYL